MSDRMSDVWAALWPSFLWYLLDTAVGKRSASRPLSPRFIDIYQLYPGLSLQKFTYLNQTVTLICINKNKQGKIIDGIGKSAYIHSKLQLYTILFDNSFLKVMFPAYGC